MGPQSFGTITDGQTTSEQLTASGGHAPYRYYIYNNPTNMVNVPSWATLSVNGVLTLNPPPGDQGTYSFYVYAFDNTGIHSPFARDKISFTTAPPSVAPVTPAPPNEISVDYRGQSGNGDSGDARISRDGRYVWFTSTADLVPSPMVETTAVYIRDTLAKTTQRLDLPSVTAGDSEVLYAISPDGRYAVVSATIAGPLARYDQATQTTQPISANCAYVSSGSNSVGIEDGGDLVVLGCGAGGIYRISTGTFTYLNCPGGSPGTASTSVTTVNLDNPSFAGITTDACGSQRAGYRLDLSAGTLTSVLPATCSWNLGNVCVDNLAVNETGQSYLAAEAIPVANGYSNEILYNGTLAADTEASAFACGLSSDGQHAFYSAQNGVFEYTPATGTATPLSGPEPGPGCNAQSVTANGQLVYTDSSSPSQVFESPG